MWRWPPSSPPLCIRFRLRCADRPKHRTPYALRHSYAAWMIAAGVGLFDLSRLMGTSVEQLDRTYGHVLADSLDRARTALDRYVVGAGSAKQHGKE